MEGADPCGWLSQWWLLVKLSECMYLCMRVCVCMGETDRIYLPVWGLKSFPSVRLGDLGLGKWEKGFWVILV